MATTIVDLVKRESIPAGPKSRPIPANSGEAAIYSPEYLARKEGNNNGAYPNGYFC